mmetsp:Transcript_6579/g.13256  ORF Transcript_6579/g.13256 Transcript_6579/m.13256 type:complete len:161 (-) Transcript_6579:23-505(-)|eukprot:CAMPEP_0196739856 /NCGR_PEP_ID=MMETSP1091-20130531/26884_1 /TAXON_ID=302021 /ORGANISM="Rhodomonas sp., Strain CCMP768" /LENGTH=160 /DNA_ID=CAMNT_0042084667 /DNA_START=23 /DNA_END=505 /DNA_ORIENTATION=-
MALALSVSKQNRVAVVVALIFAGLAHGCDRDLETQCMEADHHIITSVTTKIAHGEILSNANCDDVVKAHKVSLECSRQSGCCDSPEGNEMSIDDIFDTALVTEDTVRTRILRVYEFCEDLDKGKAQFSPCLSSPALTISMSKTLMMSMMGFLMLVPVVLQ